MEIINEAPRSDSTNTIETVPMESPWILVLETACRGDAGQPRASSASEPPAGTEEEEGVDDAAASSSPTFRQSTLDAWTNHSSTALLECDIALFPEDLTLSRLDFLASVWRLPRQVLQPCGRENVLLFPPLRVPEYSLVVSACQLQASAVSAQALAVPAVETSVTVVWDAGSSSVVARGEPTAPPRQNDSVLAHVEVALDVTRARKHFLHRVESTAVLQDYGVSADGQITPLDHPSTAADNNKNKTELLHLLEGLKSKIEGDVRAIDQILTFMAVVSFVLVLCLVKLVFCDSSSHKSSRRQPVVRLGDPTTATAHPGSAWLAAGDSAVGTGQMIFRTPRTPVPGAAPATTLTGTGTGDESPCHALALEWTRRKQERRRNRQQVDMGPRRLIPPASSSSDSLAQQHDEGPTSEADSREPTNTTTSVDECQRDAISTMIPPVVSQDDEPTPEQPAPEQLVRSLWGFGL